jgi:hypothetical protein
MSSPRFYYVPLRLQKIRETLERRYDPSVQARRLGSPQRVSQLLAALADAVAEGRLDTWSDRLSRLDVLLLTDAFPRLVPPALQAAVGAVAVRRYTGEVGKAVFTIWCNDPMEPGVSEFVRRVLEGRAPPTFGIDSPDVGALFAAALEAPDPIAALAERLTGAAWFAPTLQQWTVWERPLGDAALSRDLADTAQFDRVADDGGATWRRWVIGRDGSHPEDSLSLMDRYIRTMTWRRLDPALIHDLVRTWGDFRTLSGKWRRLTPEAQEELRRFAMDQQVQKVLEKERYQFWRRYLDRALETEVLGADEVLLMRFDRALIAEFLEPGNACRIFDPGVWPSLSRYPRSRRLTTTEKTAIKDLAYVDRLEHRGRWPYSFAQRLMPYLGRPGPPA